MLARSGKQPGPGHQHRAGHPQPQHGAPARGRSCCRPLEHHRPRRVHPREGGGLPLGRRPPLLARPAQAAVILLPAHGRRQHIVRLVDAGGRIGRPGAAAIRKIGMGQPHQHAVVVAQGGGIDGRRQAQQRVVVRAGAQHGRAHKKTRRLAQLGLQGFVLGQALGRPAAGQDQQLGAVVEQQARLAQRQGIAPRKGLEIQQARAQGRPVGARCNGTRFPIHGCAKAWPASSRLAVQTARAGRLGARAIARACRLRGPITVVAFIAVV